MIVEIDWTELGDDDDLWSESMCLYAHLHPKRAKVVYVGKADFATIRQRWHGPHKRPTIR
jgi:hypothetical protein